MSVETLIRNRAFALGAGVAIGAILLSAILTGASSARQGEDDEPPTTTVQPQPMIPAFGTADSNGSMIAVTGIDLTGASILYLIDSQSKHLAIYQATGGAPGSQGVKLIGARRIDLDLQLDGLNDRSEYTVQELEKKFSELGQPPVVPAVRR